MKDTYFIYTVGSVQNSWDIGCKNPPNLKHKSTHLFFSPSSKYLKQLGHNWHKKLGFCPDWIFKGKWNLIIFLVPCSPDRYIFPLLYHIIAHIIIIPVRDTQPFLENTLFLLLWCKTYNLWNISLPLNLKRSIIITSFEAIFAESTGHWDTGTPPRAGAQVLFLLYSSSLFPQLPQFSNLCILVLQKVPSEGS